MRRALVALAWWVGGIPVAAQTNGRYHGRYHGRYAVVDVGVGTVEVDHYRRSFVTTVAPTTGARASLGARARVRGDLFGSVSRFASGHLTTYGAFGAALDVDLAPTVRFTWNGEGATGAYRGETSGQHVRTGVRATRTTALGRAPHTVSVAYFGELTLTAVRVMKDNRTTRGAGAGASVAWRTFGVSSELMARRFVDTTYADVETHVTWSPGRGRHTPRLEVSIDRRLGDDVGGRRWGGDVSGLVPVLRANTFVVTAGASMSDLERGAPGGIYFAVALRIPLRRASPGARPSLPAPSIGDYRVSTPDADDMRVLQLRLPEIEPSVRTVELASDCTEWRALVMTHVAGDVWVVRMRMTPGTHRINVRANGGEWHVPRGLPAEQDGFGGTVGIVVVR